MNRGNHDIKKKNVETNFFSIKLYTSGLKIIENASTILQNNFKQRVTTFYRKTFPQIFIFNLCSLGEILKPVICNFLNIGKSVM